MKAPRAGEVKTRLAQELGGELACSAYRQMVERLCYNLAELPGVELHFSPANGFPEIEGWARAAWLVRPQAPGDLGRRLWAAFEDAFKRGGRQVVIIGSDCATITPSDIHAAWAALRRRDLVLGPAKDGGYWLIGLRLNEASLFRFMRWSSGAVCHETILRAQRAGLKMNLLRVLADVDTAADWQGHLASLQPRQ